jgi:hypothetical protein
MNADKDKLVGGACFRLPGFTSLPNRSGPLPNASANWQERLDHGEAGKGIPLLAPRHREVALRLLGVQQFPDGVAQTIQGAAVESLSRP